MSASSHSTVVENNDRVVNERAFRGCLGQFATGVTVITARSGARTTGVTANSFSSLSLRPPLIMWSLDRKSNSFEVFEGASHFAVNILAHDQIHISQTFSRSSEDKFAGVAWKPGIDGAPLLEGTLAFLQCRKATTYDGGDHVILIGEVLSFVQATGTPLLFVGGRYAACRDHPDLLPPESSTNAERACN